MERPSQNVLALPVIWDDTPSNISPITKSIIKKQNVVNFMQRNNTNVYVW